MASVDRARPPIRSALALAALLLPSSAIGQEPPAAGLPSIPGITSTDPFPMACVSCHVVLPDGTDVRISTLVERWTVEVDPTLLAQARSSAPTGLVLTGRHPEVADALVDIPAGCLSCHGRTAELAPPFARLVHRIHFTGGSGNHFLTMFQGTCTYCHKLDEETGAWSIPGGPEP